MMFPSQLIVLNVEINKILINNNLCLLFGFLDNPVSWMSLAEKGSFGLIQNFWLGRESGYYNTLDKFVMLFLFFCYHILDMIVNAK